MKKQISTLVAVGFAVLVALGLGTAVFLIYELQHAITVSEDVRQLSKDIRGSGRRLIADYLMAGDAISTLLLDVSLVDQRQKKIAADSVALAHLNLASTTTKREDLRLVLEQLKEYDRTVTDSIENAILDISKVNIERAKELYLTEYLPARKRNMELAAEALRLANTEVNDRVSIAREEAARVQTLAWMALGIFSIAGIAFGAVFSRTVRSIAHDFEEAARSNKLLTDNARDIICSFNESGEFIDASPATSEILGYSPNELIGKNYRQFVIAEDISKMESAVRALSAGQTLRDFENRCLHRSGAVVHMLWSATWSEKERMLFCIGRDVTEQKALRQQLEETVNRRAQELQRFATTVQRAQEEERRRIARELHDDLGQRLSGMKMGIEAHVDAPIGANESTAKFRSLEKQIDLLISDIRRISSNLRPEALDDFGLVTALKLLCKEIGSTSRLNVHFSTTMASFEHYDPHIEIAVYRIAQEALSNVAKHSRAPSASLTLTCEGGTIRMSVVDGGNGRDSAKANGEGHGLGLISMRERAELLGGTFEFRSSASTGSSVTVVIPLRSVQS